MAFINLSVLLADATPAPAAAPAQPQPGPGDLLRSPLIPMMIVLAAFLYISSRSQKKKMREHEERLKSLKPGDRIMTSSGIIGSVITVKDKSVSIRSADSKLEVSKNSITEILERDGESSES